MARVHRVEARLSWDEKADAMAVAFRRGLTLSALFRSLLLTAIDAELQREEMLRKMRGQ
jgi:antitoxin component of RelBE/YafQ-DinJ toxin-antitoxin module